MSAADDFDQLAMRHLDGLTTPAEQAEFERLLEDGEHRRRLIALARQHALLAAVGFDQPAAALHGPDPAAGRPQRSPPRRWPLVVAALVAAALALAVVVARSPAPMVAPVHANQVAADPAQALAVRGPVTLAGRTLVTGDRVPPGLALHCSEDAATTIGWTDGATLAIRSGSEARLVAGGTRRLALAHGRVEAVSQPGRSLAVESTLGSLQGEGATFTTETTPQMLAVAVQSGSVSVIRHQDARRIDLAQGDRCTVAAQGEPVVEKQTDWRLLDDGEATPPRLRRLALGDGTSRVALTTTRGFSGESALLLDVDLTTPTAREGTQRWGLLSLTFDRQVDSLVGTTGLSCWVHAERPELLWVEILGSGGYQTWERFERSVAIPAGWSHVRLPWRSFTRRDWQMAGAPTSGLDPGDLQGVNFALSDATRYTLAIDRIAAYREPTADP